MCVQQEEQAMFDFEFTEYIDVDGSLLFDESVFTSDCGVTYLVNWHVQGYRYPFIIAMDLLHDEDMVVCSCDETRLH